MRTHSSSAMIAVLIWLCCFAHICPDGEFTSRSFSTRYKTQDRSSTGRWRGVGSGAHRRSAIA
jgi:hypothetical protein